MSRWDTIKSVLTFSASDATPMPPATLAVSPDRDALIAATTRAEYAAVAYQLATYQDGKPTYPDADVYTLTRGQARLALIARCLALIADAAGVAPLRVYDEAQDDAELPTHPMRRLMTHPNPDMGPSDFVGTIATYAALTGFCVVEKERNNAGQVIALWPLEPDRLRAVLRSQSAPAWEYRIPGRAKPHLFEPDDVIAFTWKTRVPRSPYGIGALEPAIREMALLNGMTDFLKVLFERGGVPLYGLITDPDAGTVNQHKADEIQERFIRRHGGLENAGYPIVLAGIKDVKRLAMDMNELAMVAIRDLSDLAICQAFGVPAHKAGTRAGLEHTTENATAEVEDGSFYRDTMIPFWTRLDEALTVSLLPDFLTPAEVARGNITIRFDQSNVQALQEDRNAKAAWVIDGGARGMLSVHTVHKELGLPEPEGDDFYLRGLAVEAVPVDAPPPAPEPAPPLPPNTPPQLGAGRVHERYAKAGNGRARIAKVAEAREPSIRAFLADQGTRLVPQVMTNTARFAAHVGANGSKPETLAMEDIDWDAENAALRQVLTRLYLMAGRAAFDGMLEDYGVDAGIDFDLANPQIGSIVQTLGEHVVGINETTRADIAERVATGLNEGKSTTEIADSLNGLFEETYKNRAMTIARTESMHAYGRASAIGFRESGVVDRIQCFDNEAHADPYPGAADGLTCAQRNGLVDSLDSADLHIESEHPNGSLVITPVLAGEAV